jgi:hypothetical protein
LTNINIKEIRITPNQVWININDVDHCFGLFEAATLLSHIEEKSIKIDSREFHKHNNYVSFKNNFMLKIYRLLENCNHNKIFMDNNIDNVYDCPFWVIDAINYKPNKISVTLKNVQGEKTKDD